MDRVGKASHDWTCPRCGQRFVQRNARHSCAGEKGYRVWLALVGTPLLLGLAFLPFAAWFASARGLSGEALAKAIEPVAVFPATVGFTLAFALTRRLARKDGRTLAELGWRRPTALDVAIGLGAGGVLAALNARLLYPWVRAGQPSFDPELPTVSLTAAVVTLVVAAAAEDTLYRGYALSVLQGRYGTPAAVLVSSAFYALVTPATGLPLVLWAGCFGLVLCGLRLWLDNLWPVTLAHCVVALGPKLVASL